MWLITQYNAGLWWFLFFLLRKEEFWITGENILPSLQ